jgi:menaquinone-dependent protoporphyrinogen IX oxidase
MSTLVVYASKHGATQGIAERIAAKLGEAGQEAEARPVEAVDHLIGYDAFVVGSAVYAAHWQKEASAFVRQNRAVLASRPVWLFGSGPLGTEATDAKGRDLTVAAEPKEIAEFERYAELGIALVMPTARLCRLGGEMPARTAPAGRWSRHNHRPSRKASRVSDGL